ncbi:MAG TPA: hypothetical protein VFR05_03785 [Terriglobia bacterium]|nr:hypothetical protein [Terriglobia bacterium]
MRIKTALLIAIAIVGFTPGGQAQNGKAGGVFWVDNDFQNIPEPKSRDNGYYAAALNSEAVEQWKRATDIPRYLRLAAGTPKPAANVNALDEVPDSSWFTNRHALRHMTVEQLVRGPNRGDAPDLTRATITKAKMEGVTPGLHVADSKGNEYIIKFDLKNYPELQSGAEMISTKILYALGYNVPENYIGRLDPKTLEIKDGVEIGLGNAKHPFTREDLDKMLQKAAQQPDGTYRVLASKMLKGTPKGPFPWVGLRTDDANDLIPHEHRRELRGLRVIASWINHWDLKEGNTLDMYVEEGGRKFLRHFLIDFGSTLGGGKSPMEYFHGREYAFDTGTMVKETFSLGFYVAPDEKNTALIHPAVGIFSANDFDPGGWKPSFHVMPFDNMTREDAYWATRMILAFSEAELRQIIDTAEYTDPKATEHIFKTLVDRRQQIARYWFKDINPIGNFSVSAGPEGPVLQFDDLMVALDLAPKGQYRYELIGGSGNGDRKKEKKITANTRIPLGTGGPTQVRIWTTRDEDAKPVIVHLQSRPGGALGILRIERS